MKLTPENVKAKTARSCARLESAMHFARGLCGAFGVSV